MLGKKSVIVSPAVTDSVTVFTECKSGDNAKSIVYSGKLRAESVRLKNTEKTFFKITE